MSCLNAVGSNVPKGNRTRNLFCVSHTPNGVLWLISKPQYEYHRTTKRISQLESAPGTLGRLSDRLVSRFRIARNSNSYCSQPLETTRSIQPKTARSFLPPKHLRNFVA